MLAPYSYLLLVVQILLLLVPGMQPEWLAAGLRIATSGRLAALAWTKVRVVRFDEGTGHGARVVSPDASIRPRDFLFTLHDAHDDHDIYGAHGNTILSSIVALSIPPECRRSHLPASNAPLRVIRRYSSRNTFGGSPSRPAAWYSSTRSCRTSSRSSASSEWRHPSRTSLAGCVTRWARCFPAQRERRLSVGPKLNVQ